MSIQRAKTHGDLSFQVAGIDRSKFDWTQHRLVEHLSSEMDKKQNGPCIAKILKYGHIAYRQRIRSSTL